MAETEMIRLRVLGTIELEGGRAPRSILGHPRDLAVLAYLAVTSARGAYSSRDQLVAVFWPESDERRGRNALSQALHRIRRATGDEVCVKPAAHAVALDTRQISTDVSRFEDALSGGDHEAALKLYRGTLLEGFHAPGTRPFERWLDAERSRFARSAAGAARRLRESAFDAGDLRDAVEWARRAIDVSHREERDVRRLIELLGQCGERVAALRVYEEFEEWLASELELKPAPETRAAVSAVTTQEPAPVPSTAPTGVDEESGTGSSHPLESHAPAVHAGAVGPPRAPGPPMQRGHPVAMNLASREGPRPALPRLGSPKEGRRALGLAAVLMSVLAVLTVAISNGARGTSAERMRPDVDEEALAFYQRGLAYRSLGGSENRRETWNLAVEMFQNAVEKAPEFAAAHAMLGLAHLQLFHWGFDRSTERQVLAKLSIDRSLELDPDLPEAHKALGYYHEWAERDYERALEAGRRAVERLPEDVEVLTLLFASNRRLGRAAEAIRLGERLVQLAPGDFRGELASTYLGLRDYASAGALLDQSLELFPAFDGLHYRKWLLTLLSSGDTAGARKELQAARVRLGPEDLWRMEFGLDWLTRDYGGALDVLVREGVATFYVQQGDFPIELMYGLIHRLAGNESEARDSYRRAIPPLEAMIQARPDEPWFHGWLGVALAGAGRRENALAEAELAEHLAELVPDVWENPYLAQEVLLHVYIMTGEHDRAIGLIRDLLASHHYRAISRAWIEIDPRFDPLRMAPRFQRIVTAGG